MPTEKNVQGKVDLISQELQHCVKATGKGGQQQQEKIVNSLRLELQLRSNRRKALQLETSEAAFIDKSPLDEFLPFWTVDESPYKII